jgi:acyl carrier protein
MKNFDKVASILFELSGNENIELNHSLQNDLGLDSLQMVTLLIMIDDAFEIVLDESDMNPFDLTIVLDVVNLTEKYINGESNEENR